MINLNNLFKDDLKIRRHQTQKLFLDLHTSLQKEFCNPFNLHTKTAKGIWTLSPDQAEQIHQSQMYCSVYAGMKICPKCQIELSSIFTRCGSSAEDCVAEDIFVPKEKTEVQLNSSLTSLGVSPLDMPKPSKKDGPYPVWSICLGSNGLENYINSLDKYILYWSQSKLGHPAA